MPMFWVTVRYRTNSGCNAKTYAIFADDMQSAINDACDRQRKRRGVIRIDGGDCIPDQLTREEKEPTKCRTTS